MDWRLSFSCVGQALLRRRDLAGVGCTSTRNRPVGTVSLSLIRAPGVALEQLGAPGGRCKSVVTRRAAPGVWVCLGVLWMSGKPGAALEHGVARQGSPCAEGEALEPSIFPQGGAKCSKTLRFRPIQWGSSRRLTVYGLRPGPRPSWGGNPRNAPSAPKRSVCGQFNRETLGDSR